MIISKDLQWLEEYIEASSHLIPNLSTLKRVTSIHGRPDTDSLCSGQLWKYKNGHHRMSLYLNYYSNGKKVYISTIDLLSTLAHELSHLQYFLHTPDHKTLEAMLTIIFMGKLKSTGYISDEHEKKEIK